MSRDIFLGMMSGLGEAYHKQNVENVQKETERRKSVRDAWKELSERKDLPPELSAKAMEGYMTVSSTPHDKKLPKEWDEQGLGQFFHQSRSITQQIPVKAPVPQPMAYPGQAAPPSPPPVGPRPPIEVQKQVGPFYTPQEEMQMGEQAKAADVRGQITGKIGGTQQVMGYLDQLRQEGRPEEEIDQIAQMFGIHPPKPPTTATAHLQSKSIIVRGPDGKPVSQPAAFDNIRNIWLDPQNNPIHPDQIIETAPVSRPVLDPSGKNLQLVTMDKAGNILTRGPLLPLSQYQVVSRTNPITGEIENDIMPRAYTSGADVPKMGGITSSPWSAGPEPPMPPPTGPVPAADELMQFMRKRNKGVSDEVLMGALRQSGYIDASGQPTPNAASLMAGTVPSTAGPSASAAAPTEEIPPAMPKVDPATYDPQAAVRALPKPIGKESQAIRDNAVAIATGQRTIQDLKTVALQNRVQQYMNQNGLIALDKGDAQMIEDLRSGESLINQLERQMNMVQKSGVSTQGAMELKRLKSMTNSFASILSRGIFAERGVLTNPDIERAKGLLPGYITGSIMSGYGKTNLDILHQLLRDRRSAVIGIKTGQFTSPPPIDWDRLQQQAQSQPAAPLPPGKIRLIGPDGTVGTAQAGKETEDWLAKHPDWKKAP